MPDLKHLETRTRVVHIHYSDPTSTREWIVWRSRDRDEILAHLTNYNIPPIVDTVANVPRYLRDAELTECGPGVWKYKANYARDPNTIAVEINYTGGTQKMMNSLALVNSYNCDTEVSGTSVGKIEDANAAIEDLTTNLSPLETAMSVLATFIDTARSAALDDDVDTTVRLLCIDAIDAATNAKNYANEVFGMATLVRSAVQNTIYAAQNADAVQAASSAASAQSHHNTAAIANAMATSEADDAASAAALAVSAASGGNAETIAAAAAVENAGNSAQSVATYASTLNDAITTAADAASDLATAIASDNAGGIPNIGRLINVSDRGVDGVDIEEEKCDITITKHFVVSALPTSYIQTLELMSPSKNNAVFTINYKGQSRTYQAGELKFKNFTYKQEGDNTVDITYYLAYSRNITEADNYTIANSPAIVKKGWDYISVLFVDGADTAGFCKIKKAKAAYVHQVLRDADFNQLQL